MEARTTRSHRRLLWGILSFLLVAAIGASLYLGGKARERDEAHATSDARTTAELILAPLFRPGDLAGPANEDRHEELQAQVHKRVLASGPITGVTLWAPDATIVFSTDYETVGGQSSDRSDQLQRVILSGTESEVDGATFRTFVPFRLEPEGAVQGVIELDRPYAPIWTGANRPWRIAVIGLAVALLVTGTLFGLTFRPASGTRTRRMSPHDIPEDPPATRDEEARPPRRLRSQPISHRPSYTQPGFREQMEARENAERRVSTAEERAHRAEQELRRTAERLRATERRLEEVGSSGPADPPVEPQPETGVRHTENRAEAAERRATAAEERAELAESRLSTLREAADRTWALEQEVARLRTAQQEDGSGETGLADLREAREWAEAALKELEETRGRAQAAEERVLQLEAELAEAQSAWARAEEASAGLEELRSLEQRVTEDAERIRAAEERAARSEQELQAAKDGLLENGRQLEETEARIEEWDRQVREAQEQASSLQQRLGEAEARIAAEEERLREAEDRAARAEGELEQVRDRATRAEGPDPDQLEEALRATQERLRRSGERLQATEERARTAERELEQIRQRLEKVEAKERQSNMAEALRELRGESAKPLAPSPAPVEDRRASAPFMKALSLEAKNAVSGILGLVLAMKHTHDPDDLQSMLRRLSARARKMDRLVADLVDADKLARGAVELQRRRTDLQALVRRVVEECDIEADRNIQIQSDPAVVAVDPVRAEQIVTALLTSAQNRTGPGGHIWVRVESAEGGAVVAVEDEEVSSDASVSPVVTRLADLHGGWAKVEGRPNGGSSFRVFLPERAPAPAETADAEDPSEAVEDLAVGPKPEGS